jgi:hypothetical protein
MRRHATIPRARGALEHRAVSLLTGAAMFQTLSGPLRSLAAARSARRISLCVAMVLCATDFTTSGASFGAMHSHRHQGYAVNTEVRRGAAPALQLRRGVLERPFDPVYLARTINGRPLPFEARMPTTTGAEHAVRVEMVALRLQREGRFDATVVYRRALVTHGNPSYPPNMSDVAHGTYRLDPVGRLTLFPDPKTPSVRAREPWYGTLAADRVVLTRSIQEGRIARRFRIVLIRDPSVF